MEKTIAHAVFRGQYAIYVYPVAIVPFERAARARLVQAAERCPRDGRYRTVLRSVLGVHVVDFPLF